MQELEGYVVNKEKRREINLFNVFDESGKIIGEIKIKDSGVDEETGKKYYSLKTINSFNEGRGVISAILNEVEKFIKEQNAIISTVLWNLELERVFKKRGWRELARTDSRIWLQYDPSDIDNKNSQ